jgi:tetratricopeptide (TPR) repeat protein
LNKEISSDHLIQAQGFFERALLLDPSHIEALFGCAVVGINSAGGYLTDDRPVLLKAAEATVNKVLSLAPNHAGAHSILGSIYAQTSRAAQAIAKHEQALALDQNLAYAHADIGLAKLYIGRGAETEAHVREALRVSPRDLRVYLWTAFVGFAKLFEGADTEAVAWLRRSVEANRNYALAHFYLATTLAHLGESDEARVAAQAGMALNPGFSIHRYRATTPSTHPGYLAGRERVYEGMRKAGVPDG